ncbi:fluoride efflux transporter CrcB [Neobacillus sp. LXY-4]|uniref:fluoride efflux transporter CrcB n=1 Tax=Neobacillus sp. LXY-4 TaxID=3379826 RepID=UPI003EE3C7F8
MKVIFVMFGGYFGAISRFWVGEWIGTNESGFPFNTLAVNLVGSLLLGWVAARYKEDHPHVFLLLGTGFLGSFTTFSTFSVEILKLVEIGRIGLACSYVLVSFLAGICLAFAGFKLAKFIDARKGKTI